MSHYRVLLVEPNTELARIVEGYFVRSELEVLNAVDAANAPISSSARPTCQVTRGAWSSSELSDPKPTS